MFTYRRSLLRASIVPALLLAGVAALGTASAQVEVPAGYHDFTAPFSPEDGFGQVVATDGTVIAAIDERNLVIYSRTAAWPMWAWQETLPLWSPSDFLSSGLAVQGERVVVGEINAPSYTAGAVRVLRRSGTVWIEEAVLEPADGLPGDGFGTSVDIDGATIVVGAPGHGTGGSVYVFTRAGFDWTERTALSADDAASGDDLGSAVALAGDVLAAAALGADVGATTDVGAVYVFEGAGASWSQQERLVEPGVTLASRFGFSLAADADTLLVGSPNTDTPAGLGTGAGYVWKRSGGTWVSQGQLAAPLPFVNDFASAGFSVALQGDEAVLGAPFSEFTQTFPAFGAGIILRFDRSGTSWTSSGASALLNPIEGQHLGWSVALGADTLVGGAPGWEPGGAVLVGPVWPFEVPPWIDLGYGLEGTVGVPRLVGSGPLTTGSSGSMTLSQAAPRALALMLVAAQELPLPFKGGTLVPLPPLLEAYVVTSPAGDLTLPWAAFPPGVPPLAAQFVIADAAAPNGVALSNALAIVPQ